MTLSKNAKKQEVIRFGLLIVSVVFLFNPNINLFDFLPDCIGYFLLIKALRPLSLVSDEINDSLRVFRKLFVIDILKIVTLIGCYGVSDGGNLNSALLTASFVFFLLESFFLYNAFFKLFNGVSYTILNNASEENENFTELTKLTANRKYRFLIYFMIFKSLFAFLPELAALNQYSNVYDPGKTSVWFANINVFRVISFVIVFIVGIIWVVRFILYFKTIVSDRQLMDVLKERSRTETTKQTKVKKCLGVQTSFHILTVGFLFLFDFYIYGMAWGSKAVNGVNLIPDFVAVILFSIGIYHLYRIFNEQRKYSIFLMAYGGLTLIHFLYSIFFLTRYSLLDLRTDVTANRLYWILLGITILESVVFVGFLIEFIIRVKTIANHSYEEAFLNQDPDYTQRRLVSINKTLKKRLIPMIILGALAAGSDIAYYFMLPFFDWTWILSFAFSLVFIIYAVVQMYYLSDFLEDNEMLK